MTSEFNLLDEKWILVMDDNGKVIECNLKEVFEKAHEVRKLAGEIPTQDAAMFRFLLAVLYAVYQRVDENGNPCEMMTVDDAFDRWEALWNKDASIRSPYPTILSRIATVSSCSILRARSIRFLWRRGRNTWRPS